MYGGMERGGYIAEWIHKASSTAVVVYWLEFLPSIRSVYFVILQGTPQVIVTFLQIFKHQYNTRFFLVASTLLAMTWFQR